MMDSDDGSVWLEEEGKVVWGGETMKQSSQSWVVILVIGGGGGLAEEKEVVGNVRLVGVMAFAMDGGAF